MSQTAAMHGSAVLIGETGVLIRGVSGSGKSTLLLDLLDTDPKGAHLVADDRVIVTAAYGRLIADVPTAIAGLVELRGVGIVRRSCVAPVVIRLVVDLKPRENCVRLPDAEELQAELAGVIVPRFCLPVDYMGGAGRVRDVVRNMFNPTG